MLFSNRLANTDDIQQKTGQDKLTLTTTDTFFEINLDSILKINNHIKSIVSKVAKSSGILYKVRKFLAWRPALISTMQLFTFTFHIIFQ